MRKFEHLKSVLSFELAIILSMDHIFSAQTKKWWLSVVHTDLLDRNLGPSLVGLEIVLVQVL